MDVLLCFPPLVPVARRHAHAGLPALAGHLRAHTSHRVRCWDANADLLENLVGPPPTGAARPWFRVASRGLRRLGAWAPGMRVTGLVAGRRARRGASVEDAIESRVAEILGVPRARSGYRNVAASNLPQAKAHHLLDYWNLSPETVRSALSGSGDDVWLDRIGERGLVGLDADAPHLIGFSAAFVTQLTASIAMARRLRRRFARATVLVGGASVRHVSHALHLVPEVFDVVDAFAVGEGEPVLGPLATRLEAGEDWRDLPGLLRRDATGTIRGREPACLDVRESVLPDYGHVADHRYEDPSCLLLRGSIGCSWDRCRFCTQAAGAYRSLSVEAVVRSFAGLVERYGATRISLTDETVPLARLGRIAGGLLSGGVRVLWGANSRLTGPVDDTLFRRLARSGCSTLTFGLEAGTQRVNDLMDKGVDLGRARAIIDLCRRHGIECGLNAIFGFPGETEAEMLETAAFLRPLRRRGVRVGCSVFALERGSGVHGHPGAFGITRIEDDRDALFRGRLDYEHPDRVPPERILEIIETV